MEGGSNTPVTGRLCEFTFWTAGCFTFSVEFMQNSLFPVSESGGLTALSWWGGKRWQGLKLVLVFQEMRVLTTSSRLC